jgi:hypothetical protein
VYSCTILHELGTFKTQRFLISIQRAHYTENCHVLCDQYLVFGKTHVSTHTISQMQQTVWSHNHLRFLSSRIWKTSQIFWQNLRRRENFDYDISELRIFNRRTKTYIKETWWNDRLNETEGLAVPQNSEILRPGASEIRSTAAVTESCQGYQNVWRKHGHWFVIRAEKGHVTNWLSCVLSALR